MEELRHELRNTNIGTSAFVPGLTATNIGESETYRPASLKNEGPPADCAWRRASHGGAGGPRPPRPAPPANRGAVGPSHTRPAGSVWWSLASCSTASCNNDLYIIDAARVTAPVVEARCNALLESMVPFKPLPPELYAGNVYRTPIFQQEIAHRKATQKRGYSGHLMSRDQPGRYHNGPVRFSVTSRARTAPASLPQAQCG